MVSNRHDFTDSEPENEVDSGVDSQAGPSNPRKRQLSEGVAESSNADGGDSRGGSEDFDDLLANDEDVEERTKPVPPPKKAKKNGTGKPLKITLRPGISNLINSQTPPLKSNSNKKSNSTRHSDRSSLSPPPPITLKFGLKSAMAEKAAYSSSEDDDPLPVPAPPSSKKKKPSSTTSSASKSKAKSQAEKVSSTATSSALAPRKSYDWLAPSAAGASHRGPPERGEKEKEKERQDSINNDNAKITGWSPADEAIGGLLDDAPESFEKKPVKKSHKKKAADAPPGPGKAWRKGIKKGMTTAVKAEDGLFTPSGSPLVHAVTPQSREGSPDPLEISPRMIIERPIAPAISRAPREPSPPFVLADAKVLGFPVYPNPIQVPKVPLGPFPKVTQYFAPINGGDVGPFPRKEPVRNWTHTDKIITGIGGGQLKLKSWVSGPESELSRLVQSDKEANEIARLAKSKTNATNKAAGQGISTGTVTPNSNIIEERPLLSTNNSFDASTSTLPTPILGPINNEEKQVRGDEEMSEIADFDEDLLPSRATTPVSISTPTTTTTTTTTTPKIKLKSNSTGGSKTKKSAPRKSNLRQEIVPSEENSEIDITIAENEVEAM
ncbi:uncharacterized protein I206_102728 [Kwoniella pini CBS 10737]|uniref:Uncharacterized protein n=1 Tax=Kwoniella pini CBS 10737 TaxID=1296096 RepID=A0AAJ8L3L8_9TREE